MSLPEGSFSQELIEKTSSGIKVRDLQIFAPKQPTLFSGERLPASVLSSDGDEYIFTWTTWWHSGEIQAEVIKLGGEASIVAHDSLGTIGTLNGITIDYGRWLRYTPPRVAILDVNPPKDEMIQLFLSTAIGNKGLHFNEVKGFIDEFVQRRTLIGRATVGLRRLFSGR